MSPPVRRSPPVPAARREAEDLGPALVIVGGVVGLPALLAFVLLVLPELHFQLPFSVHIPWARWLATLGQVARAALVLGVPYAALRFALVLFESYQQLEDGSRRRRRRRRALPPRPEAVEPLAPGEMKILEARGKGSTQEVVCPVCGDGLDEVEDEHRCSRCDTPHHLACWRFNRGCSTFGCTGGRG